MPSGNCTSLPPTLLQPKTAAFSPKSGEQSAARGLTCQLLEIDDDVGSIHRDTGNDVSIHPLTNPHQVIHLLILPPTHASAHPFIRLRQLVNPQIIPSINQFIHHPPIYHLSIHLSIHPSIHLTIRPSHWSLGPSTHPFIHPSIYPVTPTDLSSDPSIYPFIYQSNHPKKFM